MRYDYQGLFLKKPPLTPQKLPTCTTLLRSLVYCLAFLRFNGCRRARSQSFDGRNTAVSSIAGAGRVKVVDIHTDVSRVNETPPNEAIGAANSLPKKPPPLGLLKSERAFEDHYDLLEEESWKR